MTQRTESPPVVRRSRWPYVLNMVALVLLGLAVLVGLNLVGHFEHTRFDMTTGGVHTLAPQTEALLQRIDKGDAKYELANALPSSYLDEAGNVEKYRQVDDLIQAYAAASPKITVLASTAPDALPLQISQRYSSQTKPYDKALHDFVQLSDGLKRFFESQSRALNAFGRQEKLTPQGLQSISWLERQFNKDLPQALDDALSTINRSRSRGSA